MESSNESNFDVVSDWYRNGYERTYHTGLIGWVYRKVYQYMEKPHRRHHQSTILEVGAGSGEYRIQTSPSFSRYVELDLRDTSTIDNSPGVEQVVGDAQELSQFSDGEFDRVVATCVLVHLDNPLKALLEWKRVVKPGGYLTIYVPPEAGLLVRLVRRLVTWRGPAKEGLDARRIASLQHRFSYFYLDAIIQETFVDDQVSRRTFPFKLLEYDLALFHVFEIQKSTTARG